MRAAVTVGLISMALAVLMIGYAIRVGFAVFVAPIVVAELLFLGAVYLIWRGLVGGEHGSESVETLRRDTVRRAGLSFISTGAGPPAAGHGMGGRSLVGRTGG